MGDADRAAGTDDAGTGRTARDSRPSKAATILGAAIGTVGAITSMEGIGTAEPAPAERVDVVRPLPAEAAAVEPGVLSAGALTRDMGRAMRAITESPELSRRFAAALEEGAHGRFDESVRLATRAWIDESAERTGADQSVALQRTGADQSVAPERTGSAESVALERARQQVVTALVQRGDAGQVPVAALYALAGNLLVEFVKAVKKEIMSRAVTRTVDALMPERDEEPAPDLDSAETRALLRELAAALRREQDAAGALERAQGSIAARPAGPPGSAGRPDAEIAAAVRDAGERLIAAAARWDGRPE